MPTDATARVRSRVAAVTLAGCAAVIAAAVLLYLVTRPPQMAANPDVFRTVDALYTAVRLKDAGKVGECERRLHAHRDRGELPAAAAGSLDAIVATARGGDWRAAAERLYEFMSEQRR